MRREELDKVSRKIWSSCGGQGMAQIPQNVSGHWRRDEPGGKVCVEQQSRIGDLVPLHTAVCWSVS